MCAEGCPRELVVTEVVVGDVIRAWRAHPTYPWTEADPRHGEVMRIDEQGRAWHYQGVVTYVLDYEFRVERLCDVCLAARRLSRSAL